MKLPLPELPQFNYINAETAEQAIDLLHENGAAARILMGGTDLLVQMRNGDLAPDLLVDLKNLPGMDTIVFSKEAGLTVGGAVTMNALAQNQDVLKHYPLLAEAAESVASYQLRNRATVGGNLCNASPAADTAPAALVLEADISAIGPEGERTIHVADFFKGPGVNALEAGEFLSRIHFSSQPKGWKGRYLKIGRNAGGDLAIVGVAVMGFPDMGVPSNFRFKIALASVAPIPIRVHGAEEILAQNPITEAVIEMAAEAAQEASTPIDDVRASARYRKAMVRELTRRNLIEVWSLLKNEGGLDG
ncbi:MAG TPA: xanthine dehydrogenase family protein subunit M [Anaerolineales bacterium]|nr:xanthine dehydrogenase family protein subunit M [Anaerolineales bacterium]